MNTYAKDFELAQYALENFEEHGHGMFLWQAYANMREAAKSFPEYEKETIADLTARHPGWEPITLANNPLKELTERILAHMDVVVGNLLDLSDATSSGSAQLREALMMDGDRSPLRWQGVVTTERIVTEFHCQVRALEMRQDQYRDPPHDAVVWTPGRVRQNVANEVGNTIQHVGRIMTKYFKENPDYKARVDEIFAIAKKRKRKPRPVTKEKASKKKAKVSNADHTFRNGFR